MKNYVIVLTLSLLINIGECDTGSYGSFCKCDNATSGHVTCNVSLGYLLVNERYYEMEYQTLFSKDMLIGLFLGFWNKVPLPDTRLKKEVNKTVDELLSLHVSLDPSSSLPADMAQYWANDQRFFGLIGQQDYMAVETVARLCSSISFPLITPCLGLDLSVLTHNIIMGRKPYSSDFLNLVNFSVMELSVKQFGIIYSPMQTSSTYDVLKLMTSHLDLPDPKSLCPSIGNSTEQVRREVYQLMSTHCDAIVITDDEFVQYFFEALNEFEESDIPIILIVTDFIDNIMGFWKKFEYPRKVYLITGFPLISSVNSSLLRSFNQSTSFWGWPRRTYAMLEGFLYARFFQAAFVRAFFKNPAVSRESFLDAVFSNESITVDDVTFGPYSRNSTGQGQGCNPGPDRSYIWTMDADHNLVLKSTIYMTDMCQGDPSQLVWIFFPGDKVLTALFFSLAIAVLPITIVVAKSFKSCTFKTTVTSVPVEASIDAKADDTTIIREALKTKHRIMPIPEDDLLEVDDTMGRGASAAVVHAEWHGTDVAVKKLYMEKNEEKILQFVNEIELWSTLKHPCIVDFYGVTPLHLFIVMEYMNHGSLSTVIRKEPLSRQVIIDLAMQIAIGMNYLHCKNVIHRDLNPNNILITGSPSELRAKISDFGLSVINDDKYKLSRSSSHIVGTPPYAAPEALRGEILTVKADVFSFALTLLFMATRREPFENDFNSRDDLIRTIADNHIRPSSVGSEPFTELIERCWEEEPTARPSDTEIITELQQISLCYKTQSKH